MKENRMFAGRLRELLTALGLSQGEFAKRLGVSQSAVSQWLSGTREPKHSHLQRIIDTFHINPARLFRWE